MKKIRTISVLGPTASGKTGLAIELAKRYDGEVVSCDSMQLYRDMNIGTATPTVEERDGIPHHMFDVIGPEEEFSAADYATKIDAVGVYFENYDKAVVSETNKVGSVALAKEPNVYLVPIGNDVMRSPAGTERKELCWKVVDQVLPLPYTIGSTELDSAGGISSMVGFDGTSDSGAGIRRHSTLRAGYNFTSTRLVGRSAWNTRWMLVIPASSLNSNFEEALKTFRETVTDIKIGIRAYSRSGN